MSVGVLVVCTANICRSPLAHVLLEQHLADRAIDGEVTITSAGTHARHGDGAAELSAVIAARRGLDLSGHRSAPLDQRLLDDSALVLTMTERHRDSVVADHPGTADRCFTLREFARLVDDVDLAAPPADLAACIPAVVAAAHRRRTIERGSDLPREGTLEPAHGTDDIDDPYGRPEEHYLRMARELTETITPIADVLFGPLRGDHRSGPSADTAPAPTP